MINDHDIKQNLAYAYNIIAMLGLDDHTYTHLSARTNDPNAFYLLPFGLRFSEVTKDNLLTISLDGKIISGTEHIYNPTGYHTHGNIYKSRPDIQAIFHLHTPAQVAVSAQKNGLLPMSQWALHFYNQVNYHDYDALVLAQEQGKRLAKDLDNKSILIMRNHGTLITAKTIHLSLIHI